MGSNQQTMFSKCNIAIKENYLKTQFILLLTWNNMKMGDIIHVEQTLIDSAFSSSFFSVLGIGCHNLSLDKLSHNRGQLNKLSNI